ncbi:hypothetical protein Tsubulata_027673, partial [Turnera subulata]
IDCGAPDNANYTDEITGITYLPDSSFISTGVSHSVSPEFKTFAAGRQQENLRSFPEGDRNCYKVGVKRGTKYLIRAIFMYGNYDGRNILPQFDLHLGPDKWVTMDVTNATTNTFKDIIHVPTKNYVHVCLVNTGSGTPFISALELRPLNNNSYVSAAAALALLLRYDMGSTTTETLRYPADVHDRVWVPYHLVKLEDISTSQKIDMVSQNNYQPPSIVMSTTSTPKTASEPLEFSVDIEDPNLQVYFYVHFAEIAQPRTNQSRQFNITINGKFWYGPVVPDYLYTTTVYSRGPWIGGKFDFSLFKVGGSTLPPLINAIESVYGIRRNWQGDPCAPRAYMWDGLDCTYRDSDTSRITSLRKKINYKPFPYVSPSMYISLLSVNGNIEHWLRNLSSYGLTGEITNYIADLTDLSNNSLNGSVPDFLSRLPSLKVLLGGNPNLCTSGSCKKKHKTAVAVVASVAAVVIIIEKDANDNKTYKSMEQKNRCFTKAEVLNITNNFERVLGKGGFGTVYHGYLDDVPVAVKMLSPSSAQGYKQFQAEVKLLLRVHHRNLTNLIGFCDEGTTLGLIYEYMANGDLEEHLSDTSKNILSWERRLQIAYLHNGCKPPIVHRDVKTSNILLNESFQAKLADFGLSRTFTVEDGSHVSTAVAGTPGYLDPEYHVTSWLTEKSDVYSFGVVLLRIITGKPVIPRTNERGHISQWVGSMLANGDIKNIVDPKLHGMFNLNSVWKAVEIAVACTALTSTGRPTMNQVVTELSESLGIEAAGTKYMHQNEPNISNAVITESLPLARLDCGLPDGKAYTDASTKINYTSDAAFVESGMTKNIANEYNIISLQQQLFYVRSFPEGRRSCYHINVTSGTKYLIRATFMYGNYDNLNKVPGFDLHLGPNLWDSVKLDNASDISTREILYVPSLDYVHVCLINTDLGTPFISALELRPLKNNIYPAEAGALVLYRRLDVGSIDNKTVRYGLDVYDRIWKPFNNEVWGQLSTIYTIDLMNQTDYQPPSYVYVNGGLWHGPITPRYLYSTTVYNATPFNQGIYQFMISATGNATLPPILNALEIYAENNLSQSQTDQIEGIYPTIVSCKTTKIPFVPVVASVASLFVLVCACAAIWIRRRKHRGREVPNIMAFRNLEELKSPSLISSVPRVDEVLEARNRRFTFLEIRRITDNFQRVLGKGGFGTVYYGHLHGTPVAVKMLSSSSVQGYDQFRAEVKLLLRAHHGNLTTLIGYCHENHKMGLVYEYMANGNLEQHLSDLKLDWRQHKYLHHGCRPPIVHRDVKTSNILLNDKFQAKLSDFGLSRSFPMEGATHVSTGVAGTFGYLDPEYYTTQRLTTKSDVYSFGVVLLEIITRKPANARTTERTHISQWVRSMLTNSEVKDIVDPRLGGDFDSTSVQRAVDIAMACVTPTSAGRPTMQQVVNELNQCLTLEMARRNPELEHDDNDPTDPAQFINVDNILSETTPLATHLDCGLPDGNAYKDASTKINYTSDAAFVESGISKNIATEYHITSLQQQLYYVRSFPEVSRSCYYINVTSGAKYLIRATFMYGNYDNLNKVPGFDLHLGPNLWDSVKLDNASDVSTKEILYVPSLDYVHVCLVNTDLGTLFISALELRPLKNNIYPAESGALALSRRLDVGSLDNETVRYGLDDYDRIWKPVNYEEWGQLSTEYIIDALDQTDYQPPSYVMSTAVTPANNSTPLVLSIGRADPLSRFYVALHFAELEELQANQNREFEIYVNGKIWHGPITPRYLYSTTIYIATPFNERRNNQFLISATGNATLPPVLNAKLVRKPAHRSHSNPTAREIKQSFAAVEVSCKTTSIPVVPVVACVASLFVLVCACAAIWIIRREQRVPRVDEVLEARNRRFTFLKIRRITDNFQRVLGKGGFGTVYYGHLHGIPVAVKMLSSSSVQGYDQFRAEVKLLLLAHHGNLTTLIGYCHENHKMGLVYEYMANGNLEQHLSGLEYLHHGCRPPIVHRDVKTSNILLNDKFQAKLSDFGLSRSFPMEGATHSRYYTTQRLTTKSDVYSFGVVLLEIITRKPANARTTERTHISQWVRSMLANGEVKNIVDPRLGGDFESTSLQRAVAIAMACVTPTSGGRPTMQQVVNELNQCLTLEMARRNPELEHDDNDPTDPAQFINVDNILSETTPLATQ